MAMDPPSGNYDWDVAVPKGDKAWNLGDNDIRNAMLCIEEALDHEHENLSDKDARGAHREGSARAWVDSQPTYDDEYGTGRIFFDPTDRYLEVCEDGATDAWEEIQQFNNEVEFTAGLKATGGAGSDVTLESGSKLIVPSGENHVYDGSENMDLFDHAVRHQLGGADVLDYLVNAVTVATQSGSLSADGYIPGLSITLNYNGRSGASHGIALAYTTAVTDVMGWGEWCIYIRLGSTNKGPGGHLHATSQYVPKAPIVAMAYISGIPASDGQLVRVYGDEIIANGFELDSPGYLVWIDLGVE